MDSERRDLLPPSLVDFRAPEDDAWYGVWLEMVEGGEGEEECLRVMYCHFPQSYDETFGTGSFKDLPELEEFRGRFRPTSIQIQDLECSKIKEGMTVCASFVFGESDVRFYDAVVRSVHSSKHTIVEDSEVCTCTFELLWQHGPNAGMKSTVCIENVCLPQDEGAQSDPQLDHFLELSRSKLQSFRHLLGFSVGCSCKTPDDILKKFDRDIENRKEVVKGNRYHHKRKAGHDINLEFGDRKDNYHFIWIENLEKDLLPQNITDFLYQYTSILSQASVLPSSSSESFTRGIVYVETKEKAMQLSYFLDNPSHIISSSRGRPWVIPEKQWSYGSAGGSISRYEKLIQSGMEDPNNKIKLVDKGTNEYEKAMKLHERFMEVHKTLRHLHKKLASWERTLMQSS